jgi:phage terminase small subunit
VSRVTAAEWKKRITRDVKAAGTYQKYFGSVIDTLARILERRDDAEELFIASGGNILVKHTNKGGATNIEQNPALRLINDLNRDALAYWRDLGLTPAGYKRLNLEAAQAKSNDGFEKILSQLRAGDG